MEGFAFVQQIEDVFSRYWGGHFEAVTAFFSRPRPREQLLAWLDVQLYKEIHVVPRKAQELIDLYEKLDAEVERGEYEAEAYEMADEIQHYRLLADIRELITGKKLKATEAAPTKEQRNLEAVRRKYSTSKSALVRAVGGFSPGGGVAFAAAGAMIEGGPIERALAEAFKIIYRQEHVHYHQRRLAFDRLAREGKPSEYPEAMNFARELARQHFILRNESFGYPLGTERIQEIDAGKVTPYLPPRLY